MTENIRHSNLLLGVLQLLVAPLSNKVLLKISYIHSRPVVPPSVLYDSRAGVRLNYCVCRPDHGPSNDFLGGHGRYSGGDLQ